MTQQLTLDFAQAVHLKEVGLTGIELANDEFVRTMRQAAKSLSAERGSVTSDDLHVLADKRGMQPHHPNAWGAIFRGKGWHVIDRVASQRKDSHAREIKVWRWNG